MSRVKQIDVSKSTEPVSDFMRGLRPLNEAIHVVVDDQVIGRLVPPGELSVEEKEQILKEGWELVQQARARNKEVSEREIAKVVDTAVKRVRSGQ